MNLKRIMCCFQACSRLKTNFNKSSITGMSVSDDLLHQACDIMGCTSLPLPIKYLGLPLHFKKASFKDWTPVIDKFTAKLDTWKANYLSLGGRLTLVNSVLIAIPTYYLSVLHFPAKVEKELDKIRHRFLWKSHSGPSRGHCLAKWNTICRDKNQDGWGIINLRNFSSAMKCKLLWQLFANILHLKWPALVRSRYFARFQAGALLNVSSSNCSPLWQEFRLCFPIFCAFTKFSVKNGEQAIFWENRWADGIALKYSLLDLYELAIGKKLTVARIFSKHRRNDLSFFMPFDPDIPTTNKIFINRLNLILSWNLLC